MCVVCERAHVYVYIRVIVSVSNVVRVLIVTRKLNKNEG